MNRNPAAQSQRRAYGRRQLALDQYLAEVLLHGGLGDLIPLKQRGQFRVAPALGLLILAAAGWIGLPWPVVLLSFVVAFTVEALAEYWYRRGSGYAALVKRPLWARIRAPFYWSLAVTVVLGAWLYAGGPLFAALLRGGFEWLCFRTIEDLARHPERYRSTARFQNWLVHLRSQQGAALQAWFRYAFAGTLLAIVLNLSSAQIWEAVGQTAWSRLLIFGAGLYLLALLAYRSLSGSAVRSAVQGVMQEWEGVRPSDLKRMLRSAPAVPGLFLSGARSAELVEEQLQWKNQDSLAARVGQQMEDTLVRRYQWHVTVSSAIMLVVIALLIGASVFLIVPRDIIAHRIVPDLLEARVPALAIDDLADLGGTSFWQRLVQLDGPGLATEPLPRLAFLEAIIIVSLIMFETSASRLKADLDPAELRGWLALGTTYLGLLEKDFQYLASGFITRISASAGIFRFVSLRNDVLLVPSAQHRRGAFKAICHFAQVYGQPDSDAYPSAIAIFDTYPLAQEWIEGFVRLAPVVMKRPVDLARGMGRETGRASGKYWIWSGNHLLALSDLDEARWYARLVPNNGSGKGEHARDAT